MHKISICSAIKNRCVVDTEYGTKYLFKNFLLSIQEAYNKCNIKIELVLCDFESTDIENIYTYTETILNNKNIPIKLIQPKSNFNRGLGCNLAIESASHDVVLVLDVDMKFDENLFNNLVKYTCINKCAYFPICYTFEQDPLEQHGSWLEVGYGNCGLFKKDWLEAGKIPEYNTWGHEDLHFYEKLKCHKIRDRCKNFIHQWHPSDLKWKNRYYNDK